MHHRLLVMFFYRSLESEGHIIFTVLFYTSWADSTAVRTAGHVTIQIHDQMIIWKPCLTTCQIFHSLLSVHLSVCLLYLLSSSVCMLTREDFASTPSNGDQVLDQVLAVCGLAAARLAQQHNGLILSGGEQIAVGRLGHRVDMRSRVLSATAFEHVHHLIGGRKKGRQGIYTPQGRTTKGTNTKAGRHLNKSHNHSVANLEFLLFNICDNHQAWQVVSKLYQHMNRTFSCVRCRVQFNTHLRKLWKFKFIYCMNNIVFFQNNLHIFMFSIW